MPTKAQRKGRGQVVRVRTKRLADGTLLRVFVTGKPGPRGGRTIAEKVQPKRRRKK